MNQTSVPVALTFALVAVACSGKAVVDGPSPTTTTASSSGSGGMGGMSTTTTTGGTGGATAADCGPGFCNELMMSSCGDSMYLPQPSWSCTTPLGNSGYCCVPTFTDDAGSDPCNAAQGYCTLSFPCQPGYTETSMGCDIAGQLGSCCMPNH